MSGAEIKKNKEKLKAFVEGDIMLTPRSLAAEEAEIQRVTNYDIHVDTIAIVERYQFDNIKRRILSLPLLSDPQPSHRLSRKQGLPLYQGIDLFSAIIQHQDLREDKINGPVNLQKMKLLTLLLDSHYVRYYAALLKPANIEILSKDIVFNKLLKRVYMHALRRNKMPITMAVEEIVWSALIAADKKMALEIFKTMLLATTENKKVLQFVAYVMSLQNTTESVLTTQKFIEDKLSAGGFDELKTNCLKIIKQRLLKIELEEVGSPAKSNETIAEIKEVLGRHRFFNFRPTKSLKIFDKITKDIPQAKLDYEEENEKFVSKINRLFNDPNTSRSGSFRMC